MPEIGARVVELCRGRIREREYQPQAGPWRSGWVTWASGTLGKPLEDGWVQMYGSGINYPYIGESGKVVGGPNG